MPAELARAAAAINYLPSAKSQWLLHEAFCHFFGGYNSSDGVYPNGFDQQDLLELCPVLVLALERTKRLEAAGHGDVTRSEGTTR